MYSPMQRVDLGKSFGSLFIGIILGAVSVKCLLTVYRSFVITYLMGQALRYKQCANFLLLLYA